MMNNPRSAAALAALGLALVTGLSACGSSSDGSSGDSNAPIVIGSLHPVSGPYAGDGQQMHNGAQMAIDEINAAGGIKALNGRKLKLEGGDTKGDPETGQSEAQRLIQKDAVALIGSFQSSVSTTIAAVAERNKVPFVMDVSNDKSILEKGYQFSFRVQPNSVQFGESGAQYLEEIGKAAGQPITKVAFIHEETAFGTAMVDSFIPKAKSLGITVDPVISYDAATVSDLTTQVTRAAAAGAQVIAVSGYYRDGVLLAKAVNAVKPNVLAVYGVADGAFDLPQFPKDAAPQGEGYLDVSYHIDSNNERAKKFTADYTSKFGETPRTGAGLSFDAVNVIAAALEKAGSTDPNKVRDAIRNGSVEGIITSGGPIEFDDKGENKNALPVVMQVRDGKPVQVYPEDLAEQPIKFPAPPSK